jgi:hypothetical protein
LVSPDHLSTDRERQILALVAHGMTYARAGYLFDLSRQRIHQIVTGYAPWLAQGPRKGPQQAPPSRNRGRTEPGRTVSSIGGGSAFALGSSASTAETTSGNRPVSEAVRANTARNIPPVP